MDVRSEDFDNDQGKGYQSTYTIYSALDWEGRWAGMWEEKDFDRAVSFAGSGRSNGSGLVKKTVKTTTRTSVKEAQFTDEKVGDFPVKSKFVVTESTEETVFTIATFNEEGQAKRDLYLAKKACQHDKGTVHRSQSWGAGCSYDVSHWEECSFCGKRM